MEVHETDVLIIGGGGAGCRAAIEASEKNVDVIVMVKSLVGKSGCTPMAEGGYNAALGNIHKEDSWEVHFRDTVIGGAYLNNQKLVEILVKEAPERIYDLENYGAVFDRTEEGYIAQRPFGHQTYIRTCYASDRTGHEMMITLLNEIRRRDITLIEDHMAIELLKYDSRVTGAIALDMISGDLALIKSKATILATGGGSRIYKISTNSQQTCGDGYAMAYRAGAELIDMEQVQFHPTGMVFPESAKGILVTEAVRGEGGILLNKDGERFMLRYSPEKKELAGRDVVARAIATEILEGRGTKEGGVYLDVSHLDEEVIEKRLETMFEQFMLFGVDIRKEPMQVAPTAHHFMGGVRIDEQCRTSLPGLYAAGETAGGVHGGNRLGGNALADTQVFGKRAGEYAAEYAKKTGKPKIERQFVEKVEKGVYSLYNGEGVSPIEAKKRLTEIMWDKVGIFREEKAMSEALKELERMKKEDLQNLRVNEGKTYNLELIEALQLRNMVTVAEMVTRSALYRKESRGAHCRLDFKEKDDKNWLVNVIVKQKNGKMTIYTEPVVFTILRPGG
ncbi:MAG: fumarate reductase (CoM/CoB) subunit TfrA [Candidatus Hydrothermarchaeota archaeon]